MKVGKSYRTLKKTIGIHVLNFISIPEKKDYHSVFSIRDLETNQQKFKDFELHTIELIKFDEHTPDDIQSIVANIGQKLDLWVAFLTKYQVLHQNPLPPQIDNPVVGKALSILAHMSLTDIEKERYESKEKWFFDEEAILHRVRKEGREEGIEQGIHRVAIQLLSLGQDVKFISKATGLSIDTIKTLKQSAAE